MVGMAQSERLLLWILLYFFTTLSIHSSSQNAISDILPIKMRFGAFVNVLFTIYFSTQTGSNNLNFENT